MNRSTSLEDIKRVSQSVTDSELNQLRLEEELLVCLVQKRGERLGVKKKAFDRLSVINRRQLELLGSRTK